jgi:pimeloyl-ACP methyl ester carboxylesterase
MEKTLHFPDREIHVSWILSSRFDEKRPTLIFLHEALGSIPQWKSFPLHLCDILQFPGLIIERTGHGHSSDLVSARSKDYLHEYAQETELVIQEVLGGVAPYILIGHSDGGSIALIHAAKNHKHCLGIATMAAHTFVEAETIAGIKPAVQAFEAGKLDGLYRIHGDKTNDLFYAWADTWRSPDFRFWDIRKEILQITCPILAIQGENDQYGTYDQLKSIATIGAHAQLEWIPGCGHHPHLEASMIVTNRISNWILEILEK